MRCSALNDFLDNQPISPEVKPGYRMELAYWGTTYFGWQSQTHGRTVQDLLEKALTTLLRHPVQTIAASRTDSGVHAEQQVVLFRTNVVFNEEKWVRSLNGLLPEDVGVLGIKPAPPEFHPIYSAKGKIYRYRLWQGVSRNPHCFQSSWSIYRQIDLLAMRQAAALLEGIHDFTSFCAVDSSAKTRVRHIYAIEITEKGSLIEVWVYGKGFLKQMVRIIVGTLVEIGLGKRLPEDIVTIIEAKNRSSAGKTAPAQGLALVSIFYHNDPKPEDFRRSVSLGGFARENR